MHIQRMTGKGPVVYYEPISMKDHVEEHPVNNETLAMVKAFFTGKWTNVRQNELKENTRWWQRDSRCPYPTNMFSANVMFH